jgi:hypothetical protein
MLLQHDNWGWWSLVKMYRTQAITRINAAKVCPVYKKRRAEREREEKEDIDDEAPARNIQESMVL